MCQAEEGTGREIERGVMKSNNIIGSDILQCTHPHTQTKESSSNSKLTVIQMASSQVAAMEEIKLCF